MSTRGALLMSDQTTYEVTPSATSSRASACGAMLYDELVGQTTGLSGQAVVRASPSAQQACKRGLLTSGTFGRTSTTSLKSADLQKSLESRLQARLSNLGSTLYKLTWKDWVTPLGQSRSRLRASVPRTSATDFSGWVTPTSRDHKDTPGMVAQRDGKDRVDQLPRQAYLTGWPTSRSADGEKNVRTAEGSLREIERKGSPQDLCQAAQVAGWPTPTVSNNRTGNPGSAMSMHREDGSKVQQRLQDFAAIAGPARLTASGQKLTGSSAGMESGGQLNPAHSRLVDGAPARVVRLRAYGNAINAEAATEFIKAYLDTQAETRSFDLTNMDELI